MKIHHVQNIQRALDYLEKDCKIKLVNIGSGNIQQGDAKLTLGLVWTLILHFQVLSVMCYTDNCYCNVDDDVPYSKKLWR